MGAQTDLKGRPINLKASPIYRGRLYEDLYGPSHLPQYRAGVGTLTSRIYRDRLPWRHRARPSATLDEIQGS